MATARHLFCRPVDNQGEISVEIIDLNVLNAETRQVLDDALADRNLSQSFSTVDEMWENLNT